jgi:hypothetical protein
MNIKTVFPSKYVSAEDLAGRRVEVTVAGAEMVKTFNRRANREEERLALSFHNATKRMLLNKTQAYEVATITGSFETDAWPGQRLVLRTGRAPNGKPTIVVEKAAAAAEHLETSNTQA